MLLPFVMPQQFLLVVVGLFFVLASSPPAMANPDEQLPIGIFSQAEPGKTFPDGWQPLTFEKIPAHTQYDLIQDGDVVVSMIEGVGTMRNRCVKV